MNNARIKIKEFTQNPSFGTYRELCNLGIGLYIFESNKFIKVTTYKTDFSDLNIYDIPLLNSPDDSDIYGIWVTRK